MRAVHCPGCEAGAKPATGNCVVRHNSEAAGKSSYWALVEMAPFGSTQSTRRRSPARTWRATNHRKIWRWVGGNDVTAFGVAQVCSSTEVLRRLWATVAAKPGDASANKPRSS